MVVSIDNSSPALGFAPVVAAAIPASGPAAPIVATIAGLAQLGLTLYHLFSKYDPRKLHDTAMVENFAASFHSLWYSITGEELPGIPGVTATAQPGQYGAEHIDLFRASAYPNVPMPAGNRQIDVQGAQQALAATFQDFARQMQRPESVPNLKNNYDYFQSLLQRVADAQTAAGYTGAGPGIDFSSVWPWAIPAALVLAFA